MPPNPARPKPRPRRGRGPWSGLAGAVLAGAAAVALAAPLAAQSMAGEPPAASPPATASLEASLALTTLQGGASWMGSATGFLGLIPRLALGGTGSVLLGSRSLPGSARGTDQKLRIAYGGLVVQYEVAHRGDRSFWVRLLGGAGNAKVDLALVGTQIASDNFGVLVPEIGGSVALFGPLHVGAALGYRVALGVEDLPGLAPADLRGPSARVLVAVHRF